MLGLVKNQSRLYFLDKKANLLSFSLSPSFADAVFAISNEEDEELEKHCSQLSDSELTKIAKLLSSLGKNELAFKYVKEDSLKLTYAIKLHRLDEACDIAERTDSSDNWRRIGDLCMQEGDFDRAEECYKKSHDFNSLFLIYSSLGN